MGLMTAMEARGFVSIFAIARISPEIGRRLSAFGFT